MLLFLWVYVLTAAAFPGGERLVQQSASAFQARLRAQIESPAPPPRALPGFAVGAAANFAR